MATEDEDGERYLTEKDLEVLLEDVIPEMVNQIFTKRLAHALKKTIPQAVDAAIRERLSQK